MLDLPRQYRSIAIEDMPAFAQIPRAIRTPDMFTGVFYQANHTIEKMEWRGARVYRYVRWMGRNSEQTRLYRWNICFNDQRVAVLRWIVTDPFGRIGERQYAIRGTEDAIVEARLRDLL